MVRCGDGPGEGSPGASGVGIAPASDVLRQHTEAGLGCTQLQKEPYEIGCDKEGLRIRTDGLDFFFVYRREGSVVHCLRETGPDEGG